LLKGNAGPEKNTPFRILLSRRPAVANSNSVTINAVKKNRFLDSVLLMEISSQMKKVPGVEDFSAFMGTQSNLDLLEKAGLLTDEGRRARPNDLLIAVKADDDAHLEKAQKELESLLERRTVKRGEGQGRPTSLDSALAQHPEMDIVLISLPGQYVKREALKALKAGKHLMIFSDNVTLEEEIEIKREAAPSGLLVMGPDCGTAIVSGKALGFANVVRRGPVGIVGASGTGIQEVTVLLDRMGIGTSHALGTGGRDPMSAVGGLAMLTALEALSGDPSTEVIVIISKLPDRDVAEKVLARARTTGKPVVVNFLGLDFPGEQNLTFARTLEETAVKTAAILKKEPIESYQYSQDEAERAAASLAPGRKFIRALFSGGTLGKEALLILSDSLGAVYSNIPLKKELKLAESLTSIENTLVDLGEDEFTKGVPHPMIDMRLRTKQILKEAHDPSTGVLLLDIVTGYGAHPDPAGELAPVLREARQDGKGPLAVAHVCGTEADPQPLKSQEEKLRSCGVHVFPSNAAAARFAAAVALATSRERASKAS
jgi:FdrA protein